MGVMVKGGGRRSQPIAGVLLQNWLKLDSTQLTFATVAEVDERVPEDIPHPQPFEPRRTRCTGQARGCS
eukprot:6970043-Prymnesium_polylepis.1